MSNFWRNLPINPRSRIARAKQTAEDGNFGASTYLVQGRYLDRFGIERQARFQFKLLEMLDRQTGFQSQFRAKFDSGLNLHHIDLGLDPNLGLHRLEQITKRVAGSSFNQLLDSAQIDPHATLLHAVQTLDPKGQYEMHTGILKITGSPSIPVDRRILTGEVDLRSTSIPPDLKIYYHIHVDGDGNRTIVMNNAQAQRFTMDFDGDPLIFHKLIGETSSGRKINLGRGHKYPILSRTGEWIEVPDWNPLADLGMVTPTRISHLVQHFGSAQGLQADALASSRREITDEVARRQIQAAMVPDIIGQTFNKLNAESRAEAELALAEGLKTGALGAERSVGAKKATFLNSYGLFEGFHKGLGLEGTGQKALFNEFIIKTVAKGKPIPESHPAYFLTRGFDRLNQLLQTQDQSRTLISTMVQFLDQIGAQTPETLAQTVMELLTGQHTGAENLINRGRIKTKLTESIQRPKFQSGTPSIIQNLQEMGQLKFKTAVWSGSEVPEWYRLAKPHETHFEVTIPEHLVNGRWMPLGGSIPDSFAINRAKRGVALPHVWTESDTGAVELLTGLEHLEQHMQRHFASTGYQIRDSIQPRMLGQAVGTFDPSVIGTDRGRWARKSISKQLGITESDIFDSLHTDISNYESLVQQHDLKKYNYKIKRALKTLKEAGDMFGTEITYANENLGIQLEEATNRFLRGIAMFDTVNPAEFLTKIPNILKGTVRFRKNKQTDRPLFGAGYVFPTRSDGSSVLADAGNLYASSRIAQLSTQLKDRIIPDSGTNVAYINLDDDKLMSHLVSMNPDLDVNQIRKSIQAMYTDTNNMSPDLDSGVAWFTEAGRAKYQAKYKHFLLADDSVDAVTGLPARWSGKLVDPGMKLEGNYIKGLDAWINTRNGRAQADVIIGISERLSRGGLSEVIRKRVQEGTGTDTERAMYAQYMNPDATESEFMQAAQALYGELESQSSLTLSLGGKTHNVPMGLYNLANRDIGLATTAVEIGEGASFLEAGLGVHETGGSSNIKALLNDMTSDILSHFGVQITSETQGREIVHNIHQILNSSVVDAYVNRPHLVKPEEAMEAVRTLGQAVGMTDVDSSVVRVMAGLDQMDHFNFTRILNTVQKIMQLEE